MSNRTYSIKRATSVYLMFLVMGFTDSAGPVVAFAREEYNLSYGIAQMVSVAGFLFYGILSLPVAALQRTVGKIRIVRWGLLLVLLGFALSALVLWGRFMEPESTVGKYAVLLVAMLLIGAGAVFLQVGGNPLVKSIGREEYFASNLLFAQTVKAIGTACGFVVPALAVISMWGNWRVLLLFCTVITAMILTYFYRKNRADFPGPEFSMRDLLHQSRDVLRDRRSVILLLGGFMFIGGVVTMNSGVPLLLEFHGHDLNHDGMFWAWASFFMPVLLGRLFGFFLLRRTSSVRLLAGSMLLAAFGFLFILYNEDRSIYMGSVLVGFGFANIFPVLFALLLKRNPGAEDACSGLMMATIAGGAVIPPLWGVVADLYGIIPAFVVPGLSVVYLGWLTVKLTPPPR